MDRTQLQNIQRVFDEMTAAQKVAGVNLLIYKDGAEAGYWQSGFADVAGKKPFSRDTICRLFSMTKPVTAVASMLLLEQGKIELCDEVAKFIPAFKSLTVCAEGGKNGTAVPATRPLLVQDLLNMTSGYTYGAWWEGAPLGEHQTSALLDELNRDCAGACRITTRDVAERLARIPASFEPGENYCYGLSADIMGAVIEVVSGMCYSDFLKKHIFNPLEMHDTDFYVPGEKQGRLANVYAETERGLGRFNSPHLGIQSEMKNRPSFESGGAGLCSTVDDYMRFTAMLTNGGELDGRRILQKRTVEYMAGARLRPALQEKFNQNMAHFFGYTYCNFVRVAIEPGMCYALTEKGEFGWDGWLGPYMSVDLKNGLAVVMLMQKTGAGTWELTRKVKNIIYASL